MLYLKVTNTFLKNNICFLKHIVHGTQKWHWNLVDQVVFKLRIKTVEILFWSITQEQLGLLQFQCQFWVPWTVYYKMHISFFKKVLIILRWGTTHAYFWLGVHYPLKGSRTGHSVKISLWYASLLTNTRFCLLYFRISNC